MPQKWKKLTSRNASPRAGTAHDGGSITCEFETMLSSETFRESEEAAMAMIWSVLLGGASDSWGRQEEEIISDRGIEPQSDTFTVIFMFPDIFGGFK